MSKPSLINHNIEFHLKSIEILDVNISYPERAIRENKTYHYNINIQHRINLEQKLIIVDTTIETLYQDKKTRLGHIKVACIYFVESLLDFKSGVNDKVINLPENFTTKLNSISISTTRGIMFSQFRGTFLHNAILPVIASNK
jgi:hypothetical protein